MGYFDTLKLSDGPFETQRWQSTLRSSTM